MKRFGVCVVVALSITSISVAQQPAKEPPAAMLSVLVTDSHGNHVPSLTKDDFQLSIGGKPIDATRFSERGTAGAYAGEMRRIVVLFDPVTISGGARRQVTQSLHAFLARVLRDRKSTRLNSSHVRISYAVFCLKKKKANECNANSYH